MGRIYIEFGVFSCRERHALSDTSCHMFVANSTTPIFSKAPENNPFFDTIIYSRLANYLHSSRRCLVL